MLPAHSRNECIQSGWCKTCSGHTLNLRACKIISFISRTACVMPEKNGMRHNGMSKIQLMISGKAAMAQHSDSATHDPHSQSDRHFLPLTLLS